MPYVCVGENDLFYATSPEKGPEVILIHGAGGSHLHWPAALRRLPGTTVYALDLPGHGRSRAQGRERIEEYARDVIGFVDQIGAEQAFLVGHSMGGAIAQSVALTASDRVRGLVLLATGAALPVAPTILTGLRESFEQTIELITKWAWGPEAPPALVAEGRRAMLNTAPEVVLGDFLACDRFDLRKQAQGITGPALVIGGSEDRMAPARHGRWLAQQIPDGRFLLIPGAGHMVVMERPDEVASAICAWLALQRVPM